jgi:hypothetical protein
MRINLIVNFAQPSDMFESRHAHGRITISFIHVRLGVVNLLQIGVVTDCLDTLLQGNDFVVASHYRHGPELQTFREMHGADRDMAAGSFDAFIKNPERHSRLFCRGSRTIQLRFGADEHAELVWHHASLRQFRNPMTDGLDLLVFASPP